MTIILPNKKEYKYRIINIRDLEFSSERKRSSVVVQELATNKYYIYSKGAISKISSLVKIDDKINIDLNDRIIIQEHPELRVLGCCFKEIFFPINISENDFIKNYKELESDLNYLGIIGLRDSLQEGISETVKFLESKNKFIGVCTGDRKETALAITRDCSIVSNCEIIDLEIIN